MTILDTLKDVGGGIANRWPWLAARINPIAINGTVNVCRHRPHPLSTLHDYVSWPGLTDQHWSARHLPPVPVAPASPTSDELKGLFRRSGGQILSDKSTVLFPAFAQYLTDGFIRTRMPGRGDPPTLRLQTTSNHQIDLCPLYGRIPEQTTALREPDPPAGRRGRLKSQVIGGEEFAPFLYQDDGRMKPEFAAGMIEEPLGFDPAADPRRDRIFAFGGDRANATPQVAMMNTLWLREHNRVAGEIERRHPDWDDDRVFETARNTVIVVFIQIVVEEYINHISPAVFRLKATPSVAWSAPWNKPNWMTTEFSLLYRWHSLIPDTIAWGGTPYPVVDTLFANQLLIDRGLAASFVELSAQKAGRLGAFNTADALLNLETRAIDQGRLARIPPYVEYRRYVDLSVPKRFEDISANPETVAFLRNAYADVADVEFYVGLFAEETEPNTPLPPLIRAMVAVDAFSQALTNPLLSEHVFRESTFSAVGWATINGGNRLVDVVRRNTPTGTVDGTISLTQAGWKHAWW